MNLDYSQLFKHNPFSMNQKQKDIWFLKQIKSLSKHHYDYCCEYRSLTEKIFRPIDKCDSLLDLPFVPANLFKQNNIKTEISQSDPKVFTSSGTGANGKSKIFLDRKTALLQSRALAKIFSDIFPKGTKIFFIESPNILKGSTALSARGAAVKGFCQFTRDHEFLLNSAEELNIAPLLDFIENNPQEVYVIFGFTSIVWELFLNKLLNKNVKVRKNSGILIHGGGWKKLKDKEITRAEYNDLIKKTMNIQNVHNYYGMIEQTGSIFLECEEGFFHPSIFSEVIVRNENLESCKVGERGLIQVSSLLPLSYPGHNLLTEDLGSIHGLDGCACGRRGKYFLVEGRVKGTQLRGCSDVGS